MLKWRPKLGLVVIAVVATLLCLPIVGLLAARTTSNQFIHETEISLHNQLAIFGQIYGQEFQRLLEDPNQEDLAALPPSGALRQGQLEFYAATLHPPQTRLRRSGLNVLPPMPEPIALDRPLHSVYHALGQQLSALAIEAQKTSLAGYTFVDPQGRIIGGSQRGRGMHIDVPEIQRALAGDMTSRLRYRGWAKQWYPSQLLSRDTAYRVYVAHPVIVQDKIVGAVIAFRTPNNLRKFLLGERNTIVLVGGSVLLAAILVGYILNRLLAHPIEALRRQSVAVTKADRKPLAPIEHYGTYELAQLGDVLLKMSERLQRRANSVEAYTAHVTHELKSPITSISGAVELMLDNADSMSVKQQKRFLDIIAQDSDRMAKLLDELRALAARAQITQPGVCSLGPVVEKVALTLPQVHIACHERSDALVPMDESDLTVLLTQMSQNASEHGADSLSIEWAQEEGHQLVLSISDNGPGIAEPAKVFEPFYTTKRDLGGTGMGLSIVKTMLEALGASIAIVEHGERSLGGASQGGATFRIEF